MKSSHSRKSTSTSYHSPVFLPRDTRTDVKHEETDDNFFSEVKAEVEDPFQRKKSRGTTSASRPFAGPPAKLETLHGVKVEEKPFVSSTYRISTGSSSAPRQSAATFTASHNHRSLPKEEVTVGKPKATPARIRDISGGYRSCSSKPLPNLIPLFFLQRNSQKSITLPVHILIRAVTGTKQS